MECPECVFKGGTSLSKCHHMIDRFSEDIDISFSNKLSQGKRKHLKNDSIAGIAVALGMPILDWEEARSRRDYYLQNKTKRYSRHIYDIYMLLPKIALNGEFKELVKQVREVRSEMSICPSAGKGADVPKLLREIIEKEVYKEDYIEITTYFQNRPVGYENAIEAVRIIAESGMFE